MFTLKSNWKQVVDRSWELAKEKTGYTSEEDCDQVVYCRKFENITLEYALKHIMINDNPDWLEGWIVFCGPHTITFSRSN